VESRRGLCGVHEFGLTFLSRKPNSPCGYCKARMHYRSHIRVILVPKDCVCPIISSLSRDPGLNPGIWVLVQRSTPWASGTDNLTISGEYYDIWWNVILASEGIMQIIVIVDRIWFCRLQLALVLDRPMCRHLTSSGISERPVGSAWIRYNVPCGEPKYSIWRF